MKMEFQITNKTGGKAQVFYGAPKDANELTLRVELPDIPDRDAVEVRLYLKDLSKIFGEGPSDCVKVVSDDWEVKRHADDGEMLRLAPKLSPVAFPLAIRLVVQRTVEIAAKADLGFEVDVVKRGADSDSSTCLEGEREIELLAWKSQSPLAFRLAKDHDTVLLTENAAYPMSAHNMLMLEMVNMSDEAPIPAASDTKNPHVTLFFHYGSGRGCMGTIDQAASIKVNVAADPKSGTSVWDASGGPDPVSPEKDKPDKPWPAWKLWPRDRTQHLLGTGADIQFRIHDIEVSQVPDTQEDTAQLYVHWYDFPGIDDGYTSLSVRLRTPEPTILSFELDYPGCEEGNHQTYLGASIELKWDTYGACSPAPVTLQAAQEILAGNQPSCGSFRTKVMTSTIYGLLLPGGQEQHIPVTIANVKAEFTADRYQIAYGEEVELRYTVKGASSFSIDGDTGVAADPPAAFSVSGSVKVKPVPPNANVNFGCINPKVVYTLTANGLNGPIQKTVTIEVDVVQIVTFNSDGFLTDFDGHAAYILLPAFTISWNVLNATSAIIDRIGPVPLPSGSSRYIPPDPSDYIKLTLTVEGPGGPKSLAFYVGNEDDNY